MGRLGVHLVQRWPWGATGTDQEGECPYTWGDVAAAAPMSSQRWENEGNGYLVSFPLLTKIPKEIKREFDSYMICKPGTQPSVSTKNMFRDEKGKNGAYFKSPKLTKR